MRRKRTNDKRVKLVIPKKEAYDKKEARQLAPLIGFNEQTDSKYTWVRLEITVL